MPMKSEPQSLRDQVYDRIKVLESQLEDQRALGRSLRTDLDSINERTVRTQREIEFEKNELRALM